jgi:hypothetical protein
VATTYDPVWDVTIGGTGFLLANGDERPYMRETTQARRDRFDSSRDPGDNALDSALWVRSQTAWHYGAGQEFAEPLETPSEIARFQFWRSHGVDTMTYPGKAVLLPTTTGVGTGELYDFAYVKSNGATDAMVVSVQELPAMTVKTQYAYLPGGSYTTLFSSATYMLTPNEVGDMVYCQSGTNIARFTFTGGSLTNIGVPSGTLLDILYSHDRLWYLTDAGLWEVTSPSTAVALPGAVDVAILNGTQLAKHGKAIFVLVAGSVGAISVNDDGSLGALRRVVSIQGEAVTHISTHMDNWMILTTTSGVRVCDSTDPLNIIVGPLTIKASDFVIGSTAGSGDYVYVGVGGLSTTPGGTKDATGLLRIDLSKPLSAGQGNAARYAYETDVFSVVGASFSPIPPRMVVAGANQRYSTSSIYFGPTYGTRAYAIGSTNTKVSTGWLESGQINFSTAEKKAWLGIKVDAGGASGTIRIYATGPAGVEYEVTSGAVSVPVDAYYQINAANLPPSPWLRYRVVLTGNAELYSVGLQATPMSKRTRYIRLPLQCFDNQLDRNNIAVGYEGFGYERLAALEALEESGAFVTLVDNRTAESKRCVIDKITYEGLTAPDRSKANFGGYVAVTLLSV